MTDTKSIEERLRRTFQVVADQPVPPLGEDAGVWPNPARRARRLVRPLAVALAVAVTATAVVLVLVYGPRSGHGVGHPTPATRPTGTFRVVFVPIHPVSPAELARVASTLETRLRSVVGVTDFKVSVEGQSLVLSGPRRLAQHDLNLVATNGALFLRPVLCGAPSYSPGPTGVAGPTTTPLLVCGAQYRTTRDNLGVTPGAGTASGGGFRENNVPPDPALNTVPSTPQQGDDPKRTVLLSSGPERCCTYPRYVLGPAELNVSGAIASAQAFRLGTGPGSSWGVAITLKQSAVAALDSIDRQSFHALIAFDLDGLVQSDSLIEPDQTTFSPYHGPIQLPPIFSERQARSEAAFLASGSMPVPLNILTEYFTSPALAHPAP